MRKEAREGKRAKVRIGLGIVSPSFPLPWFFFAADEAGN
jgi:hypothetical protein